MEGSLLGLLHLLDHFLKETKLEQRSCELELGLCLSKDEQGVFLALFKSSLLDLLVLNSQLSDVFEAGSQLSLAENDGFLDLSRQVIDLVKL